ncbi:MAG: cyclic nucleotide-binding domain-containing protein [Pseudomonadota bacterium]
MRVELRTLIEKAEDLFAEGNPVAAMRLFLAGLQRVPEDYMARLQLADCLARLDRKHEAAQVYAAIAELCIDGGLPLVAIVASRAMDALGHPSDAVVSRLSTVYGRGSARLAEVGARLNIRHEGLAVDEKELRREKSVGELVADAVRVGSSLDAVGELPKKFSHAPILSELSPVTMVRVIRALLVHRLPDRYVVFHKGEKASCCLMIATGKIRIIGADDMGADLELATIGEGTIFGEMALVSGGRRSASAVVVGTADLLEFGPSAFAAFGEELAILAPIFHKLAIGRNLQNLLQQSAMFRVLDAQQQQDLLKRFTAHEVAKGTVLFSEGDKATGIFLVLQGEVAVSRSQQNGLSGTVAELGPGSMLGVNSVLADEPVLATATAVTPATVLFLSRKLVKKLVDAIPGFLEALGQVAEHHNQLMEWEEGEETRPGY